MNLLVPIVTANLILPVAKFIVQFVILFFVIKYSIRSALKQKK